MRHIDNLENESPADCQEAVTQVDLSGDAWRAPSGTRTQKRRNHAIHRKFPEYFKRSSLDGDFVDAPITSIKAGDQEYIVFGSPGCSIHGHYDRDDGMGTVDSLAKTAIDGGVRLGSYTPHNHKESRNGVPPDDPRYEDEKGKPNIVDDPQAFKQLREDTARVTRESNGKFIALYGQELGTISKTNHVVLLNTPTLFIADLDGNQHEYPVTRFMGHDSARPTSPDGEQQVFHYKVTDGLALIEELRRLKAFKRAGLAHPDTRSQPVNGFPKGVNPNHYFMNCYPNQYEWAKNYGEIYTFQGVIQGQGLTRGPVEHMSPGSLKLDPAFGYIDTGIKLGFVFERDQHYGDMGGRPAGMGLLVHKEDQEEVMECLAQRRTFTSTDYKNLQAVTIANDKYVMGSVINPADIDKLRFKVLIGGRLDRKATYNVKLWADTTVGDLKTASVVEEKSVTGDELLNNNQEVLFDDVKYKRENANAFVMQIERAYPGQNGQKQVDTAAATTTIWVQPEGWLPSPAKGIEINRHN
ncbi:MAG: hypothetical protein K2Y22_10145 [Candidatus Obscuribacterales bacterium]|nr:hypothetical protein [Candidatus Obscuribacterales bacterium]